MTLICKALSLLPRTCHRHLPNFGDFLLHPRGSGTGRDNCGRNWEAKRAGSASHGCTLHTRKVSRLERSAKCGHSVAGVTCRLVPGRGLQRCHLQGIIMRNAFMWPICHIYCIGGDSAGAGVRPAYCNCTIRWLGAAGNCRGLVGQ